MPNDGYCDGQEESEDAAKEAKNEENERLDEADVWEEGKLGYREERIRIVGKGSISSGEERANQHRMRFEDEVIDAVNEADSFVKSDLESTQMDQEQERSQSVFYESQDVPGTDLQDDLEGIEHATHQQINSQQSDADNVPTSA